MPYEYINRKDKAYFVRATESKNGKTRYTLTTQKSGQLLYAVPDGYEVYEIPGNGQVVLRKTQHTDILELEREALSQAIRTQAGLEHFIVDVEPKALVVYLSDAEASDDEDSTWLRSVRQVTHKYGTYGKMMRFELDRAKPRAFTVSRWCFLGSIDDWFLLDGPAPLPTLMKKYVKHLGKESFFELS